MESVSMANFRLEIAAEELVCHIGSRICYLVHVAHSPRYSLSCGNNSIRWGSPDRLSLISFSTSAPDITLHDSLPSLTNQAGQRENIPRFPLVHYFCATHPIRQSLPDSCTKHISISLPRPTGRPFSHVAASHVHHEPPTTASSTPGVAW